MKTEKNVNVMLMTLSKFIGIILKFKKILMKNKWRNIKKSKKITKIKKQKKVKKF